MFGQPAHVPRRSFRRLATKNKIGRRGRPFFERERMLRWMKKWGRGREREGWRGDGGKRMAGRGGRRAGGGRAVKKIFGVKFSKICLGEEVAPSPSER